MAHILTEIATHTANVTVPDDGDDLTAASVQTAFQALANRTDLANARLTGVAQCPALDVFPGSITCSDTATFDGGAIFNAIAYFNAGFGLTTQTGLNANQTIGPRYCNVVLCPPFTADRTYTIDDFNAEDGDWLIVINNGSNYACNVVFASDTLAVLSRNGSGPAGNGRYVAAMFHRNGGGWAPGLRSIGATNQTVEFAPTTSTTLGADAINKVYIVGGLSTNVNFTLANSAPDNSWVTFISTDATYLTHVKNGSGDTLASLSGPGDAPYFHWHTFRKISGAWVGAERGH